MNIRSTIENWGKDNGATPLPNSPWLKPSSQTLDSWSQGANPNYGLRVDGTTKGKGFFGPLPTKDGQVMTELGIGVNFGGREVEVPTVVPTLTKQELQSLLQGNAPTNAIIQKAADHARMRLNQGLSPFAYPGEQFTLPNK